MDDKDIITTLSGLLTTCKDGESGYHKAAQDAQDPALASDFLGRAEHCAAAARELQEIVSALDGLPEHGGSMLAAIHRGWLELRSTFSARDDATILAEVERGEDAARQNYADALQRALPEAIHAVVARQYAGVVRNYERARAQHEALLHGPAVGATTSALKPDANADRNLAISTTPHSTTRTTTDTATEISGTTPLDAGISNTPTESIAGTTRISDMLSDDAGPGNHAPDEPPTAPARPRQPDKVRNLS